MKDEKNGLKDKLKKYGLLTLALTGVSTAEGAIIYTDEAPDFAGGSGSQYFLDLNNDGIDDFLIWHNFSSSYGYTFANNLYISPLGAANGVLGSGGATFAYPFALNSGAAISAGAGTFFNNGFSSGYQSLNFGSCSYGNWCSVTDKYLGLKFEFGGNIHFGWVRLDVNGSGDSWTVKDYAYDDGIGVAINAGALPSGSALTADGVTSILGADIGESTSGSDLQVGFVAAVDETTISEYRMIAVKESNVGTFDLLSAQALVAPRFVAITPSGNPGYTQPFIPSGEDSDGDLITINEPYRIFVLSVADGTIATLDSLVSSVAPVTLNTTSDIALSIVGSDISENSDGSDLQVDFDAAVDEAKVGEYRIIAVKEVNAVAFDLVSAQALVAPRYVAVSPTGAANYSQTFGATDQDSDGDLITIGEEYRIFILSVADGLVANVDDITDSGVPITLYTTTDVALSIVGSDISDLANGTDLQVDFDAALMEARVSEYRIIAVKSGAAFVLADAEALASGSYMSVTPTGAANYTAVFGATGVDSDGDAIIEGQAYTIYSLSIADGILSNLNNLSSSGADITLVSSLGISENALEGILAYTDGQQLIIDIPVDMLGKNINLAILSMNGAVVKEFGLSDSVTKINHSDVNTGIYILRFEDAAGNKITNKIAL